MGAYTRRFVGLLRLHRRLGKLRLPVVLWFLGILFGTESPTSDSDNYFYNQLYLVILLLGRWALGGWGNADCLVVY